MAMSSMSDIVMPSDKKAKAEAEAEEEERQLRRDELLAKGHDKIYERKRMIFNAIAKDRQRPKGLAVKSVKKKAKMILENLKKEGGERAEKQVR